MSPRPTMRVGAMIAARFPDERPDDGGAGVWFDGEGIEAGEVRVGLRTRALGVMVRWKSPWRSVEPKPLAGVRDKALPNWLPYQSAPNRRPIWKRKRRNALSANDADDVRGYAVLGAIRQELGPVDGLSIAVQA